MKSFTDHAVSVIGGIFLDAAIRWPSMVTSIEKDQSYLLRAVEQRGLPFLTVVLPAMGKVLDKGLDNGYLELENVPKGYPLIQKRPKLFGDFFLRIFDDSMVLRPDADVDCVAFLRQFLYCCKKLRVQCDDSKVKEALDDFYTIERHLPFSHEDTWDSDVPRWRNRYGHPIWGTHALYDSQEPLPGLPPRDLATMPWNSLRRFCRYVISSLGTPDWWKLDPKHGPGAVSEPEEFTSKCEFPTWPRKLDIWFPFDWHATGSLDSGSVYSNYEPPSRLIAVPKDQRGPRLICAEPIAHQWIQQGIWRWLEEKVSQSVLQHSIDFRCQDASRKGALRASIDGSRATIDLSSASDRISTRLVEYVFQGSEILDGLHASRTRVVGQEISSEHPNRALLKKFSTMGSAVTFPIQSMIFSILTVWAIRLHRGDLWHLHGVEEDFKTVTVFGDDIIAPVQALETIKLVLTECGLKINDSKTYGAGLFRESCGCDAFKGYDVTPAYALQPYDDSPSSMATTVEVSNNFFLKGYWNTADAVVSSIPEKERKLLAICGSDDGTFGLRSFVGTDTSHLKHGWDRDLQFPFSISMGIAQKVKRMRGQGSSDLVQYFTERPSPDVVWSAGAVGRVRLRKKRTRVQDKT